MSRCACPVLWATTVPKRRPIPLEPNACAPTTKGALFVVDGRWAYSLRELATAVAKQEHISFERAEEKVRLRYPAHEAHFTRCPEASAHRRSA